MAEVNNAGVCSSHVQLINEGNSVFNMCERCKEYEFQLKETLDELSSLQLVNKLLQKELLSHTTMWESNLKPNGNQVILNSNGNSEWSLVTNNSRRNGRSMNGVCENPKTGYRKNRLTQIIPPTHNKFVVLSKLNEDSEYLNPPTPEYKYEESSNTRGLRSITRKTKIVENRKKVKHSVLIIGDSHARNSASLLQGNLSADYAVSSIVKPGAHMNAITDTACDIVRSLTGDDVIIIWGGSNDISRNNSKVALNNVYEFVKRNAESNIVLINAPQRYDLIPESCVNTEVVKFNRQIKKIVKPYSKVHLLETNLDRNHFTKHGMHLNYKGRDLNAQQLALIVEKIFRKEQPVPIAIPWDVPPMVPNDMNTQEKDEAAAAKVEMKRPKPEDSALTCPVQQSSEVIVRHTHDANQASVNEQGIVFDSLNSAQHSSLVEISTSNLRNCDHRVIPTHAPLTENKKSSRPKKPPLTRSADFLWPSMVIS
jgi:hypothetical protein